MDFHHRVLTSRCRTITSRGNNIKPTQHSAPFSPVEPIADVPHDEIVRQRRLASRDRILAYR